MGPELVKQTKEEPRGSRQACNLAKDSSTRRVPTASKGAPRSTQDPNIQRVPCGQEGAPDMPSTPARDQKAQSPPRGPRVTRKVPRGPEGALCTTRTQKAPGITGNETYMPPKVQRIRKVELVRVNCRTHRVPTLQPLFSSFFSFSFFFFSSH